MITIRPAAPGDVPALKALLAPHVERGNILHRDVDWEAFQIALEGELIVGAVALTPQSKRIVELGSLVSNRPGLGLGRRLVDAAIEHAVRSNYEVVMALSGLIDFFEKLGFATAPHAPWISARRDLKMASPTPLNPDTNAIEAAETKAMTCRVCPRLTTCRQALLMRPLHVHRRKRA
jgi:N-acetylglutamate synthase-like GNAT family acetyltransferase